MTEEYTKNDPEKANNEMFMLAHNHVITYRDFYKMSEGFLDQKLMITLPQPISSLRGDGHTVNSLTVLKLNGQLYSIFADINRENGTIRFDIPDSFAQMMLQEEAVEKVKERFVENEMKNG